MTTIAQRMRAAAAQWGFEATQASSSDNRNRYLAYEKQLRADADALEAVEREMRDEVKCAEKDQYKYAECAYTTRFQTIDEWADRVRGEVK